MQDKKFDSSVYLFNVRVDSTSVEQVLETWSQQAGASAKNKLITIFTPNPEQVILAHKNDQFRSTLNRSTINLADGIGLVWADHWLSWRYGRQARLHQRAAGGEVMEALASEALKQGKRVFLLGGKEGVAEAAAKKLELAVKGQLSANSRQPSAVSHQRTAKGRGLRAEDGAGNVGEPQELILAYKGSVDIEHETKAKREETLQRVKTHRTEVLFVAFGAPWQEEWVMANREQLEQIGVKLAMVVGGAFDVIAGNVPRAPLKWQQIGLEWLWRLIHEPRRWRRQIKLLVFGWMVSKEFLFAKNKA